MVAIASQITSLTIIYWKVYSGADQRTHESSVSLAFVWGIYDLGVHYCDVIMGSIASLITSLTSVYSTVHSGADQRKHQSSAPLAFVRGIHRKPGNSPHKWPVTRKMFPFDDVIRYDELSISWAIMRQLQHSVFIHTCQICHMCFIDYNPQGLL